MLSSCGSIEVYSGYWNIQIAWAALPSITSPTMAVPKSCEGQEHTILPQVFCWALHFFFLLRGLPYLLWSVHLAPLRSCLPMYLPSFPWNTMQWETDENLTFYLLERAGGGNFTHTHTHTTPNHLKPPTMKNVNCISKAWKCQIPSPTE